MASLAVEENNEGITLLPLDELEVSRFKIFGNEYLYLYIVQFIYLDARTIISFQQTCNANRNWNSVVLKGYEWEWRWKKIKALIGKGETDQMKRGGNFTGNLYLSSKGLNDDACKILAPALAGMKGLKWFGLYYNQITGKGWEHLAPALAKMTALEYLWLGRNRITDKGKNEMREAWKKAGKSGGLYGC